MICKWLCELNPIETAIGFLVGILTSYVYAITTERIRSRKLTKKYSRLKGKYIRYWFEDKSKGDGKIFATAEITSCTENKLSFIVKTLLEYGKDNPSAGQPYKEESVEIWTGEITMDSLNNGTIVWEQRNPNNGNGGFKRIIFNQPLTRLTIVGEKDYGFDLEVFTEKVNTL